MIPLDSATVFLPRVSSARTTGVDFPLTIVKPPIIAVRYNGPTEVSSPILRLLSSRQKRRNSSALSLRSLYGIKTECKESSPEQLDVYQMKEDQKPGHQHSSHSLLLRDNQTPCLLPTPSMECPGNAASSRIEGPISSAKTDQVPVKEETLAKASTFSQTTNGERIENISGNRMGDPEVDVIQVSSKRLPKRNKKKSNKMKKTAKKKIDYVKLRTQGMGGAFARLVHSYGKKKNVLAGTKQQLSKSEVHPIPANNSVTNYLDIQNVGAAYAPKKNSQQKSIVLFPKVSSSSSLRKEQTSRTINVLSPRKQVELRNVPSVSSPLLLRRGLDINTVGDDKLRKVYLSETQSGMISGVPCVPPNTPTVDQLKNTEYILSLTDVKSQRAVKAKLITLENKMKAEEQQKKEKAIKEEQKRAYGAILKLKQRQRAEIYALNKVMTAFENDNFRKFMEQNSVETLPV